MSTSNEHALYIEEDQPKKPEDFRTPSIAREKQLESSKADGVCVYIYLKINKCVSFRFSF
jgi:hypothetical protein